MEAQMSFDLDDLLVESVQQRDERKAAKSPAKSITKKANKLGRGASSKDVQWMNATERAEFQKQVSNMNIDGSWVTEAAVAMFAEQTCKCCGAAATHFEGFFLQQRATRNAYTERWIPSPDTVSLNGHPKAVKINHSEADSCLDCAANLGFNSPSQSLTEPSYAAWSPLKNHQKYSIESEYSRGFGRQTETSPVERR
jgi:hypothetical protein